MNRTRKITASLALVAFAAFAAAGIAMMSAGATASTFTFAFGTSGAVGTPGDHVPLGEATLPAGFADRACDVTVTMTNNDSVHTGSNLVLTSGQIPPLIMNDVEATPGAGKSFKFVSLTLHSTVQIEGIMGTDPADDTGGFSGSGTVAITCDIPATTTTTRPAAPPLVPPTPVVVPPGFTG